MEAVSISLQSSMSRDEYFVAKTLRQHSTSTKEAVLVLKRESWSGAHEWMAYLRRSVSICIILHKLSSAAQESCYRNNARQS